MKRKKIFINILITLIVITALGTLIAYFIFKPDKPWLAFYIACCGGVLIVNFGISLFFVWKNFK